jgi:hypothetical protein
MYYVYSNLDVAGVDAALYQEVSESGGGVPQRLREYEVEMQKKS